MFGVKVKTVSTSKEYTIEEFYDAIKDHSFSAGAPALTKHGLATIITFPPLDRYNQIWIIPVLGIKKKATAKFQISKNDAAGVGNMAVNGVLDDLTGGLTGIRSVVGGNVKKSEKLVELTVDELNALHL